MPLCTIPPARLAQPVAAPRSSVRMDAVVGQGLTTGKVRAFEAMMVSVMRVIGDGQLGGAVCSAGWWTALGDGSVAELCRKKGVANDKSLYRQRHKV